LNPYNGAKSEKFPNKYPSLKHTCNDCFFAFKYGIVFLVKALAVIAAIQQNILIHISSNLSE
jgi:hypothetical protein